MPSGPGHATIVMPVDFGGSNSLKAESLFVSVNKNEDYPSLLP